MDISMQQEQALVIARMLAKAGVPLFIARPDPAARHGWALPFGWETNEPDPSVVDAWRPGWALCAVTGHTFDLVDVDPRSGGSEADLGAVMPRSYLTAETPSGGRHHFVKTLGVPSLDGKVSPGIDVKSGTLEGEGRGFAFIAPTVRASKVDGIEREYRWVVGPKGPILPTPDQLAQDGSGALLRARVLEIRRSAVSETPRRVSMSQARREWDSAIANLATSVGRWQRVGWGGEAHSTILAATTRLARLSPDTAEAGLYEAFGRAGAVPDADDLSKLHSAIEKAVPDIVVPDAEMSSAELFFTGGAAPVSPGASLSGSGPAIPAAPFGAVEAVEGSRFGALTEFEAEAIEPPEPLIEGLLLSGTKARLSAPSGAGKTWLVLDLAAHIASGKTWQGKAVTRAKVLYVPGEGVASFGTRMKTWRAAHGIPTNVLLEPNAPQIASADWDEFLEFYAEQAIGLFIFDTQGSVTIGLKENDNDHANILHARLEALIRRTGACVLLVHHTGWEETGRARGASAAFGGMDTELTLTKDGGTSALRVTLHDTKQRYIEQGKPVRLVLESAHGGRVVRGPQVAGTAGSGSFFGEDAEVRIAAIVTKLTAHAASGQTWAPKVATTLRVLRDELNVQGDDKTILRPAARRYLASIGFTEFVNGE